MNPELLWSPSDEMREGSNLRQFIRWLEQEQGLTFGSYQELWLWSTRHVDAFWETLWRYFNILHEGSYPTVLSGTAMPYHRWFDGTSLNYAEHVFRKYNDSHPAILFSAENAPLQKVSWRELKTKVAALQHLLLRSGIEEGDCVAAYLPCIPEATIAFLAVNSIGAVWTSCSPDFGAQSVIDRFSQTRPKLLIVSSGYSYGGRTYDKTETVNEIVKSLPGLRKVIWIPSFSASLPPSSLFMSWADAIAKEDAVLHFRRVPFHHPIWVLYSSGTTGLPKAITHSHGGILLEHLKYLTFHNDVKPGERFFWYTTTGWMMWNFLQSSLLCGATMVIYDGSPGHPDLSVLWRYAKEAGIHHFGTSASFILSCRKAGMQPGKEFTLSSLRSISSTGSTLPPEGFDWIYHEVKANVWLASMSGGTDVCSAFVGGNPIIPVYSGEIQCRALGCSLEAFNEAGEPQEDEVGEMVITQPMPSMPIYFWNDPDFKRYTESYFERYPSVWRHGDWIRITPRNGVVIYGRSDATLNRGGVRIGTSEIYRSIDKMKEVKDSLMVCIEMNNGEFYMPLFVQLQDNSVLTDELKKRINQIIRQDNSPRHVPDTIIGVPEIPYTISGKKTETPVKKILMGKHLNEVANSGSLRNPESLTFFMEFYKNQLKSKK